MKSKPKQEGRKGKKHAKPLSLYGMSFGEAVGKILAAKPAPKKPKKT